MWFHNAFHTVFKELSINVVNAMPKYQETEFFQKLPSQLLSGSYLYRLKQSVDYYYYTV